MPRRIKSHKRRKYPKRKGRKGSRKRLKKPSSNRVSAALTNLLAVPDYYVLSDALVVVNTVGSSAMCMPCQYFTTSSKDPYSHNDPVILGQVIPFAITSLQNQSIKYSIEEFSLKQMITNTSFTNIRLTAYLCKWRRDVPMAAGEPYQPLKLLGQGFLNNGKGTFADDTNTFLFDDNSDPFMSSTFTLHCKIVKVKHKSIAPGATVHFSLKKKKPFMVHPDVIVNLAAGDTYNTAALKYDYMRGGLFYLFKMAEGSLPAGAAGTNQIGVQANKFQLRCESLWKWTYKFMNNIIGTIIEANLPSSMLTPAASMTNTIVLNPISGVNVSQNVL